jgi:hypothetical protein
VKPSHASATLLLLVVGLVAASGLLDRGGAAPVNGCVACHTDAAKLKALTPPDPPPAEAGEG